MVKARIKNKLLLIVAYVLCATPAQAVPDYLGMRGAWQVSFVGIPFARMWIAVEEEPDDVRKVTASFKSTGVARMFKKMKAYTEARTYIGGDAPQTLSYVTENKDEGKRKALTYNRAGELTARTVEPEDDPWHRPPVQADEARGAATPGSLLFEVPHLASQMQQGDTRDFLFYDGKRLGKMKLHYVDDRVIPHAGKTTNAMRFVVSRQLISGYTQKEIKRFSKGEPPLIMYIRKADFFPIAGELSLPYGTLSAKWVAD